MENPDISLDRSVNRSLLPALLWLSFCAGLIVQIFSPHLPVEHNSFVISAGLVPPGSVIDPRALVSRQRFMQASSAALVLVGAIGLAIWYRETLSRSLTRPGA
jgi:hypothetical protein